MLEPIFEHVICTDQFNSKILETRSNLRLVSRQWNEVISKDNKYWTDLYIGVSIESKLCSAEFTKNAIASLRRDLARTGTLPHRLKLVALVDSPRLVSLIQATPNWRSLELIVGMNTPIIAKICSGNVWQSLEALTLKTATEALPSDLPNPEHWGPVVEHSASSMFRRMTVTPTQAPALRSLTLHLPSRSISEWNIPIAQLTFLEIAYASDPLISILRLLRRATALETFKLGIHPVPNTPGGFPDSSGMVALQNWVPHPMPLLRTLAIEVTTVCDVLPNFVERLSLPNLEHFTFWDSCEETQSPRVVSALDVLMNEALLSIKSIDVRLKRAYVDDHLIGDIFQDNAAVHLERVVMGGVGMECAFLEENVPLSLKEVVIYVYGQAANGRFARWAREWIVEGEAGAAKEKVAKYVTVLARDLPMEIDDLYHGEDWEALKALRELGHNVQGAISYV